MSQLDAERRLARIPELVEADPDLIRRGRFFHADFLVGIGEVPFYLTISAGRVVAIERGPLLLRPIRFAVRAPADAWLGHWAPVPAPGFHDLFAMTKQGLAAVEGDLQPFMANLQYVKDLLAAPRRLAGDGASG